jgi:hypothetical protein
MRMQVATAVQLQRRQLAASVAREKRLLEVQAVRNFQRAVEDQGTQK